MSSIFDKIIWAVVGRGLVLAGSAGSSARDPAGTENVMRLITNFIAWKTLKSH